MGADTKLTALLIKDNIVLCFRKSSKSPKVNSDAEQTAATTEEAGGTLLRCNFRLEDKLCCTSITGELILDY